MGEASLRDGAAVGSADGVDWKLRFETSEAPLFDLPRGWMYG